MSVGLLERTRARSDADADAVDPRISERRRRVEGERRRGHLRALRWVLLLATLAGIAWVVSHSPLLDVDRVVVRGADHTGAEAVMAAAGVHIGDLLVQTDPASIEARLAALPWVASAVADRNWDGTLTIVVTERVPAAIVAPAGATTPGVLVDREGRVLANADAGTALASVLAESPPIGTNVDPSLRPAVVVAGALSPGVRSRVTGVRPAGDGGVELSLRPAGTVRFGTDRQVDQKVRALATVFAQVDLRCLATVDVRVPDAPVLTRVPTCA